MEIPKGGAVFIDAIIELEPVPDDEPDDGRYVEMEIEGEWLDVVAVDDGIFDVLKQRMP
jgi:hypothetical protein